jgi:MFS family permease
LSSLHDREQHASLLPVFLIVLVDVFGMTLVIPLLAIYAETFGATPLQATMLITAFAVCQLVAGPLLGHASDRTGRKPILIISQVGTCIGFLVLASATSLWMVYLSRIIDGVTAGNLSLAQAYIADNTPPERRAKSFGLIGIAFGLGFFIGPSITGLLSARYGLNAPIYLAAVMSATSVICTATLLKPGAQPRRTGERSRWDALKPRTYAQYFSRPGLRTRLIQFLFFMLSFSLFISGFALFAERRFTFQGHPFGPREIGYIFGFVGFLGIILQGGFIGRLVERFGEAALVAAGFISLVIGYFGLGAATSTAVLLVVAVVASFGNGVLRPALTSLITHHADRHEQGVVLGITQSMTSMASIVAPIVAGILIQQRLLTSWAWLAAGLAAVGVLLSRGDLKPRAIVAAVFVLALAYPDVARAQPRTLHAIQLAAPLKIDGLLDDALYGDVEPISGFVQVEPEEGAPATEKTDVWIAFDRDNVYFTFKCWESHPDRVVSKDMRRDGNGIWNGDDNVSFLIDTFHDKRNGFVFTLNSIGGRQDGQEFNERVWTGDWNAIWDFHVGRFEGGWVVEVAIPFKSLRYGPGSDQVWGFNAFRTNRWKNELSFLTPVSKARGQMGLHQASLAADVVGIVAPSGSKNLEIKPYLISNTTGAAANRRFTERLEADVGVDAKYGLTQNLTADLTYNTDFAQVEADQQQVNLTRFSLFFPEKRDFFLENQGTFAFGQNQNGFNNVGDTPIMFYSRRIGLERGQIVPIRGGGRLTGRVGRYTLGLLNIQTGTDDAKTAPATNFSVVRLRRDVLRASSIGALFTGRTAAPGTTAGNAAYGVDGIFTFLTNLNINTYWAESVRRSAFADERVAKGRHELSRTA